jgi:hypothetical protein
VKIKDCICLYDQLYHCKRKPREITYVFNDQFNTLVKRFFQDYKPTQNVILTSYMSPINDPCGFLIGKNCPSTLIEAHERECEVEENVAFSFHQNEDCLEEISQINQVASFITSPPDTFHVTKAYLCKEKREAASMTFGKITIFVRNKEGPKSKIMSPPAEERLQTARTLATEKNRR